MNRPAKLSLFVLLLGVAISGSLLWRGHQSQPPTRAFEFHYVTRIPAVPEGTGKLRLWIPVPESDNQQEISHLTIDSPVPYELYNDAKYGNRYAYLELDPGAEKVPIEVRMRFQVERREHQVVLDAPAGRPNATETKASELARSLQPDRLVPIDGMIAALAEQETRGLTEPLEKARAIYNYVVSTMRYDKSGEGWGRGDAIYACNSRKGNCTDFHALFIGMMRAAGIPARFEIGFLLPSNQRADDIPGYHCWAQFYLEGVGWVPVDTSEAWKDPARRDYFFGAHDEHRVLLSRGRDIRFNPAQQGELLNYFIYPYAELDGKSFLDVEYQFSFRDLH
ncbi:transglutaminase domain-containing protein [Acidobacteriia bacterium AH_259_A11_L15]|nr:transglutaminase domain-containing protein [Acidobacteriia bacterium AH_259_A11_L15]